MLFLYRCWEQGLGDKCCAHAGQGGGEAGLECKSLFPCCGAVSKHIVLEDGNIYLYWTNYIFVCHFMK